MRHEFISHQKTETEEKVTYIYIQRCSMLNGVSAVATSMVEK